MRLTLVIFALGSGGAERVMSILASYWATHGHTVTLVTLVGDTQPPFYALDARVQWRPLGVAGVSAFPSAGVWNNLVRVRRLRRALAASRPDAVVSFLTETNVLTLLAARGQSYPVVIAEHTDPWTCPVASAWAWLRRWTYPWASRVVVLNERAREFFALRGGVTTAVIPNPIVISCDEEPADAATDLGGRRRVVAMGRLTPEKRFDLLLHAFARVVRKHGDWSLTIFGEGPQRRMLEELRDELGLAGRVELPGAVKQPHSRLKRADLFVLSSELEGFPLALCEAMACGLPVISTEYHSAVRDIVRDGENGILVRSGDIDALAAAMDRLMGDGSERTRLGAHGVSIGDRFAVDRVAGIWERMLNEVVYGRRRAIA